MPEKPLFVVVFGKIFEKKFRNATGEVEEFRPYGYRGWTRENCRIGRRVTVSAGYGKKHRITGVITGFRTESDPVANCPDWTTCYGNNGGLAACIKIKPEARA